MSDLSATLRAFPQTLADVPSGQGLTLIGSSPHPRRIHNSHSPSARHRLLFRRFNTKSLSGGDPFRADHDHFDIIAQFPIVAALVLG
jgi:hypothetical protein